MRVKGGKIAKYEKYAERSLLTIGEMLDKIL